MSSRETRQRVVAGLSPQTWAEAEFVNHRGDHRDTLVTSTNDLLLQASSGMAPDRAGDCTESANSSCSPGTTEFRKTPLRRSALTQFSSELCYT